MKKFLHKIYGLLEQKPVHFIVVLSLLVNCIIELLNRQSLLSLLRHIALRPHVFLYNTLIVLATYLIVLIVRRRLFAVSLVSTVWIGFGIANYFLLHTRIMPFSARDFFLIRSALKVIDMYFTPVQLILMAVLVCALIVAFIFLFIKCPKCPPHANPRRILCFVGVYGVIFAASTIFAASNVAIAADYENINDAYENCGFAFCFASSVFEDGVQKPDDYSLERMEEIVSDIEAETEVDGNAVQADPNVIFVQLESFFDPTRIEGVEFSENPIPNFTELRENYPSGILYVPSLGGGTVNVEFEVLTGMSLDYFALAEYPYESILQEQSCESLAYYFTDLGYTCHAIHNNEGTFYNRNTAYANLGFDTFTSYEYMDNLEYVANGWCKDAVLTDCILDALNSTEGKDFIFTVSVQAHGKYPSDYADTSITLEENAAIAFDEDTRAEFEYYVEQLHESDAFVGELLEALREQDEEYIVVIYGDHLPALGIDPEQMDTGTLYSTEYVIWSNFGLTGEDADLDAYRLGARVLELAGIEGGLMTSFHQSCYGDEDYEAKLQALEYDLLGGEQIAYGGQSPYSPKALHMGIHDITITDVKNPADTEFIYIYGDYFTEFSVIYLNGERCETAYVDSHTLIMEGTLKDGDTITVCQAGPDKIVLSASNSFEYRAA